MHRAMTAKPGVSAFSAAAQDIPKRRQFPVGRTPASTPAAVRFGQKLLANRQPNGGGSLNAVDKNHGVASSRGRLATSRSSKLKAYSFPLRTSLCDLCAPLWALGLQPSRDHPASLPRAGTAGCTTHPINIPPVRENHKKAPSPAHRTTGPAWRCGLSPS